MTDPQPTRVAVWGLGRHAERRLLPALAASPTTTLVGVTSRDAARGASLAAAHGCTFWPQPEAMLESHSVDVVLVATPIGCHAAHGLAVLQAGKHLWCEKSLATSAQEVESLVAEARRRQLVLAEAFMFVHHPHFRQLKAAAVRIGPPRSLLVRFLIPTLAQPGFRHTRALGGGGLLDVGCYGVQAALELLGDDLQVRHAQLAQPPGYEVDMTGCAVLESGAGATALLEWGFGPAYRNEITVCGDAGSVDADHVLSQTPEHDPSLVVRDVHGVARVEPSTRASSFVEMFTALAGAPHDVAAREGLWTRALLQARLVEGIRAAAPAGRPG